MPCIINQEYDPIGVSFCKACKYLSPAQIESCGQLDWYAEHLAGDYNYNYKNNRKEETSIAMKELHRIGYDLDLNSYGSFILKKLNEDS